MNHFPVIVTDKLVFGAIFPTYVVYTKTIIHLGVDESGGYLEEKEWLTPVSLAYSWAMSNCDS